MRQRWYGLMMLISVAVVACGRGNDAAVLPSQQWGDVTVAVQTRPISPAAGMNEFLVIANEAGGKPAWDMVVFLRTRVDDSGRQAIQDGESGVYRRALSLSSGPQTLYVNLRRAGEETVLEFPLQVQ